MVIAKSKLTRHCRVMCEESIDPAFERIGAAHYPAALTGEFVHLLRKAVALSSGRAGHRFADLRPLAAQLRDGAAGVIARGLIGAAARPVRAVLFDKSPKTNWSLAWHQDRTLSVSYRAEVVGFRNWTVKQGIQHVEPPFEMLERMVTLRLHLDDVPADNAPLKIAPGSHRVGLIPEGEIAYCAAHLGTAICIAKASDIWAHSTPILHASETSTNPKQRRVLQVDYSADRLPAPLEWLPA